MASCRKDKTMENNTLTAIKAWITAAVAMLIKPIRNKLVGQYFDLVN